MMESQYLRTPFGPVVSSPFRACGHLCASIFLPRIPKSKVVWFKHFVSSKFDVIGRFIFGMIELKPS